MGMLCALTAYDAGVEASYVIYDYPTFVYRLYSVLATILLLAPESHTVDTASIVERTG